MSLVDNILNSNNPKYLAKTLAENSKNKRISLNYTQKELAERSGISLSTLKRFEQKGEISLSSLLKIAIILDATESILNIFTETKPESIDEYLKENKKKQRVRKKKK